MSQATVDVVSLSRARGAELAPPPRKRWLTRVGIPLGVLLAIALLLLYSARSLLWQQTDVWVAPVVLRGGAAPALGQPGTPAERPVQVLVQAPGWIEADPYAVSVAALIEGVVREVGVLEGQRVEKDQVVARLIDDDARLALARSQAQLNAAAAEAQAARSAVYVAEARADEVRDDLDRKRPLAKSGGVAAGELAQLEIRLKTMEREVEAARSVVAVADARVKEHEVACAEAALTLERTQVKSPVAGVVLARLVEPGTRISMESASAMMGAVVRVYDPSRLQVRVDVPIAEAAKVGVGTEAQIVTEALPDRVFKGAVTRLVHEANIQRNTVQVKVAIENPSETLKPEMLTRVRFVGKPPESAPAGAGDSGAPAPATDQPQFLIPQAALMHAQGGAAHVFIVDHSLQTGATASLRQVTFRTASDGLVEASGQLREGDRVILEPLDKVKDGGRVRVLGEKSGQARNEHGKEAHNAAH